MSMTIDRELGTALVFPGISETPHDEIARFLLTNPIARKVTATASEVLGYSLVERYHKADRAYSEYERVVFLVACLALSYWAENTQDLYTQACVGPSF